MLHLIVFAVPAAFVMGDLPEPHDILTAKGLIKSGGYYLLPEERGFSQSMTDLIKADRRLAGAMKQKKAFEKAVKENDREILALTQQRRKLNNRLSRVANAIKQNRLIAAINELTDRIRILEESGVDFEEADRLRQRLGRIRIEFLRIVAELTPMVDEIQARYAALQNDGEIQAALDELNASRKRPLKLGPRRLFEKNIRQLQKLAATVQSETIPMRSAMGVFWVEVVVNNQHAESMIFDTGASMLMLPGRMAARIGAQVKDSDRTIIMTIADGRTVEGKQTTLKSVRLGTFEVQDVACVVLPLDLENAPALLGGSFLRHFNYRVDPDAKTLILTRISDPPKD